MGGGDVVDEDDKVVGFAMVEDFGDLIVSASHVDVWGCVYVCGSSCVWSLSSRCWSYFSDNV